jgi:hypothetical protein
LFAKNINVSFTIKSFPLAFCLQNWAIDKQKTQIILRKPSLSGGFFNDFWQKIKEGNLMIFKDINTFPFLAI